MNSKPAQATLAALWLRLLAGLYDLLPLLGLWFLAAGLAVLVSAGKLDSHTLTGKLLVQVPVLVFSALYFVPSWLRGGQTIGMKPWRLRIVRSDGARLDLPHALLRFVVGIFSIAAFGLGFWWALFEREKRTWHDLAAGTVVVRFDKSK